MVSQLSLEVAFDRKELEESGLDDKVQEKLMESVGQTLKIARIRSVTSSVSPPRMSETGGNRFVSKKVKVVVGEEVGRHVVASEDIDVGEVIVEERPISSVLHFSRLATNCSTCLRSAVAGVGCDGCSQVIFCSPQCKAEAAEGYHRLECLHLHLLPPTGPLCTTLRLFTNKNLQYFLDRRSLFEDHDPAAGWEEEDETSGDGYDSLIRSAYNMQVCRKNLDYQLE